MGTSNTSPHCLRAAQGTEKFLLGVENGKR
jgi:hypothetical protein